MSPDRPDHITEQVIAMQLHVRSDGSAALGIETKTKRFDLDLSQPLTSHLTDRLVYDTAHTDPTATRLRAA